MEKVKAERTEECDLRRDYLNTAFTDLIMEFQGKLNDLQQASLFGESNDEERGRMEKRIRELMSRKAERLKELMLKLTANLPDVLTGALVVPSPGSRAEQEGEELSRGDAHAAG